MLGGQTANNGMQRTVLRPPLMPDVKAFNFSHT